MCGRFTLAATLDQILARYGLMAAAAFDWKPRYNIAPTQDHPVIFAEDGERRIQPMRWGLIPSWTKELKGDGFINAKSETVAEKPSFRTAFKRRRCLIPADGFYEWQKPEIAQGPKTPFRITMKDGGIFSMAGLWESWTAPDGKELRTFAILTCEPNDLMRPIHDRMPVILDEQGEAAWVDAGIGVEALKALLRPADPDRMRAYEVSRIVNSPANDTAACIEKTS